MIASQFSLDTSWTTRKERTLVLQATQYDQLAFAELYDHYVARIFKYIFYKVGRQDEAQDLTAQVFLKAWEAIGNYQWTDRPFAAWLYRIAHNLVVDHFRAYQAPVSLDDIHSLEEPGSGSKTISHFSIA